ncbi:MAG: AAA family ATPase, partial [Synergistales bacterium]|nr:AAA family ATPase [Synergistales bacterium]
MNIQENDRFDLTPRQIVEYLDRYIVGQEKAKKSVAIALRNRIRRRRLPENIAKEVAPKNILMVGPTGVGKTEIARRLADLVKAPFVKVEATKFTEVGYVGRDVESIVRDLAETAVAMVKKRKIEDVRIPAAERAEQRLADALLPRPERKSAVPDFMRLFGGGGSPEKEKEQDDSPEEVRLRDSTRNKILALLREGKLDDREVEIDITESQSVGIPLLGGAGMDSMGINIGDMLGGLLPKKTKRRRMK